MSILIIRIFYVTLVVSILLAIILARINLDIRVNSSIYFAKKTYGANWRSHYKGYEHQARLAICKPYFKHLFEKFPLDFTHQAHKWSAGIVGINHIEPDYRTFFEHHSEYILFYVF